VTPLQGRRRRGERSKLNPVALRGRRGLGVPVDIMPCTRSEFEEEKHEIDTLARAAFLRGIRLYERAA
jgi:hypothetical protein